MSTRGTEFLWGMAAGAAPDGLDLGGGTAPRRGGGGARRRPGDAKYTSKVVLDNARVRVKDVTFPPGRLRHRHAHARARARGRDPHSGHAGVHRAGQARGDGRVRRRQRRVPRGQRHPPGGQSRPDAHARDRGRAQVAGGFSCRTRSSLSSGHCAWLVALARAGPRVGRAAHARRGSACRLRGAGGLGAARDPRAARAPAPRRRQRPRGGDEHLVVRARVLRAGPQLPARLRLDRGRALVPPGLAPRSRPGHGPRRPQPRVFGPGRARRSRGAPSRRRRPWPRRRARASAAGSRCARASSTRWTIWPTPPAMPPTRRPSTTRWPPTSATSSCGCSAATPRSPPPPAAASGAESAAWPSTSAP